MVSALEATSITSLLQFSKLLIQKQPPEVFYKKAALENFAISTGKHLCWNIYFPMNIAKLLRTLSWKTSANGSFYLELHRKQT